MILSEFLLKLDLHKPPDHPLHLKLYQLTCEDLNDNDNQIIVTAGEIIEEKHLDKIVNSGLRSLKIRSVLTCETENGICSKY